MRAVRKESNTAPIGVLSDTQFAEYCSAMLGEMRSIASSRGLDHLAQFLSVCLFESQRIETQNKRRAS